MANWCNNTVRFDCGTRAMKKLEKLFLQMAQRESVEGCGQLPPFISEQNGWLFSIHWEDGTLYYETKWTPNTGVMRKIADRFGAGSTHEYEESGMLIFGRVVYKAGALTEINLDDTDYEQYEYDEEADVYRFEGGEYDSGYDILETLLDRKHKTLEDNKRI